MTAEQLRNSILQEAISGRLVPPACRQAGKTLTTTPLPCVDGKKVWFTYIIECEDGSFYKGFTEDLLRRYKQHCDGNGADYTRIHSPKQLYYWEMHYSQDEAIAREKWLKSGVGREWFQKEVVEKPENWEPASVLLQRIREEKARLVKEGKLKKKDLVETPITEEEIPFEIPASWEWVRLSTYVDVRDGTHDSPKYHPSGIPFVTSKNLKNGRIDFSTCTFISQSDHDKFSERSYVEDGDILFAMIGSIGNPVIVAKDREFSVKNVALFKRYSREYTNNKYLYYYLSYIQNELKQIAAGGVQSFVGLGKLRQYLIPLPPLAEQKRIVAKLEELLPIVDQYGKAQKELDELNAALPARLRQSILQEAISGRLVPQDPNEIAEDVKATEIEDEPFEIPNNWRWCLLGDLIDMVSGTSYKKGDVCTNGVRILRGGNIVNDELVLAEDDVFLPNEYENIEKNIRKDDIIIVASTGSQKVIGKPALIRQNYDRTQIGAFLRIIRAKDAKYVPYLWLVFKGLYYREHIRNLVKGTNINNIKEEYITALPIPLPPLAEQQRIVAKIEELFEQIDKITK